MKGMLMIDEQSHREQKLQAHIHMSPPSPPQELTLDNFSPKWAMRLKNRNMPTFMSLTWLRWRHELQKSSKCVVGEAYGYSSHYTDSCEECDRIGCKFLYYFTLNWRKRLELNKQAFVKHWNEEHIQYEHQFLPNICL
jgi:hypothetical protein